MLANQIITIMSEEQFLAEDPSMNMDEDSEAINEDQVIATAEPKGSVAETEGSKIDASKNEEDEGWVTYQWQVILLTLR